MSRIKRTTRTVLAVLLSLTVAATFYPATAFAGTDYEAAYNQAHEQAQTAYTDWQNAVNDAAAKKSIYDQAVADYNAAVNAVEPTYQEMLKKQRILDFKTREAIEYYAKQAWSADWGNTSNMGRCTDTEDRINYLLSKSYSGNLNTLKNYLNSKTSTENNKWNTPGQYWRADNPNTKKKLPQGITTTTSGNDDTASLTLFEKYVYFNQSYDILMLNLDYFDEMNQLRGMEGKSPLMVSPYLMLQSTVNAPLNKYGHNVLANMNQYDSSCGQNLASCWGEVGALNGYNSTIKDPYMGLFWAEKPTEGSHYLIIIGTAGNSTHAGMACSPTASGSGVPSGNFSEVFEQDFAKMSGKTGPSVATYRNNINSYVSQQLNNYNSAKTAYNNANKNVETKNTAKKNALNDYANANALASTKKTAYDNAVAAEQAAYDAWQNATNSGGGNEGGNEEPTNPVTPDPGNGNTQPSVPTSIDNITQLTASYDGKEGSQYVIYVSWNSANSANKYEIQESINGGSWSNKSPVTSPYTYIYTDKANTRFKYRVRGVYEGNGTTVYGNYTTSSECSTPAAETPTVTVGKVTNVTLTQTGWNGLTNSYKVKIAWSPVDGASKYKVFTSINNSNYESEIYTETVCTCLVPYNGTVKCKVAAMDSNGNVGPESDEKSLTVGDGSDPGSDPQPENVGPVTGVKATTGDVTVTSCKVTISWEKASNATSYTVYKSTNGKNYTDSQTTSATSREYSLTPNTKYWFKVRGTNGNTNGQMSEVLAFTTPKYEQTVEPTDQTQPVTPVYAKSYVKSFKVIKGKKSFTAKWKKQSKANQKKFAGYQIRYSLKKNMKGAKYVTVKKSAKSKKIKRLKAKKKYYVQARTYTVTGGKKIYSKWTKIKAVKTK